MNPTREEVPGDQKGEMGFVCAGTVPGLWRGQGVCKYNTHGM